MIKKVDVELLQTTYRELYELVGEENILKIFNYYHGIQLNFQCTCIAEYWWLESWRQKRAMTITSQHVIMGFQSDGSKGT